MPPAARWALPIVAAAALLGGGWALRASWSGEAPKAATAGARGPVAVEVAPVTRGPLEQRRELTGTLEAKTEIVVASKVSGRLERITVDLGDVVTRGQQVAELDDAELAQAEEQARAELAVAKARKVAAQNAQKIADRNLARIEPLRRRGIASEQEYDDTHARALEAASALAVASSEVTRAKASLRAAEVRTGYALVTVDWSDDELSRVVAARHVDDGSLVAANTPLLSVVSLDPLVVAVHVTEQDYGRLSVDQPIDLTTDAYPGESFSGRVARIAPVFAAQSRQARAELEVANPDGRLRPGMFVRVRIVLATRDDAVTVPRDALVERDGGAAVYVVDGEVARLVPVTLGLDDGERVEVTGVTPPSRVVTLGQTLLEDGAAITVPAPVEGERAP